MISNANFNEYYNYLLMSRYWRFQPHTKHTFHSLEGPLLRIVLKKWFMTLWHFDKVDWNLSDWPLPSFRGKRTYLMKARTPLSVLPASHDALANFLATPSRLSSRSILESSSEALIFPPVSPGTAIKHRQWNSINGTW